MGEFFSPRNTLIGFAGIFTIITVVLQALHTTTHCYYKDESTDLKTCYNEFSSGVCGAPAYEINKSYMLGEEYIDVNLSCPWNLLTAVIGYITAMVIALYLIMMAFSKRPNHNLLIVFRMLSMIGLVATLVFMIYDMMVGYNHYANEKWKGVSFTQVIFIVTSVFVGLNLLTNIMLSIFGTKPAEKLVDEYTSDLGSQLRY